MSNLFTKAFKILSEEGLINYYKRKRNITFLDNKTIFKMNYRGKTTKIALNRKNGHVDMMIFKHGIYEKDIIDEIFKTLTPEKNFIDIGANIGQHSLLLSPYCKNVYAFEPIKEICEQFQKSKKLNHYQNINIFNLAVGSKKETKTFNLVEGHAGTSSFVKRKEENVKIIQVHADTLENILGEIKMDTVKIDVEGYEAVVILGNKDKFQRDSPIIFMEYNPEWIINEGSYHPQELVNFFKENGFQIFSKNMNKIMDYDEIIFKGQDNWIVKK